jgi:hypothetical protein
MALIFCLQYKDLQIVRYREPEPREPFSQPVIPQIAEYASAIVQLQSFVGQPEQHRVRVMIPMDNTVLVLMAIFPILSKRLSVDDACSLMNAAGMYVFFSFYF